MRVIRVVGLAVFAVCFFAVSVVALNLALVAFVTAAFSEDCAEGVTCFTDVYVGPGLLLLTVASAVALTTFVVRLVARMTKRS